MIYRYTDMLFMPNQNFTYENKGIQEINNT